MKVLIADDEALARRILSSQLEGLGHEVIALVDGRRALTVLAGPDAPRMAILDWNMPGLDGPEVCRQLRLSSTERYTYVALLTARNRPEDLVAGLEAGADDFLVKPVEGAELRARLQTAQRILALESALLRSHAYLDAVLENIGSGVALFDDERKIVFTNGAFERLSQVSRADAIGLGRQQIIDRCAHHFEDIADVRRRLTPDEQGVAAVQDIIEVGLPRRRFIRWTSKIVPLPEGAGRLDVCQDVTRETELAEALKQQAARDPLTGLLNRRGAAEGVARELARFNREGRPLAVMLADIDHFKRVNDTLGHDVGDAVICAVAQAMTGAMRPYDILVRWGGEELLIIAPEAASEAAPLVAERIRKAVEDICIAGLPPVSVSIGVDAVSSGETDIGPAVSRADGKLYEAKRAGRNRVFA